MNARAFIIIALLAAGVIPLTSNASYTDAAVPQALEARMTTCCVYGVLAYASTPDPVLNSGQTWAHSVVGAVATYSTSKNYSEVGSQKNRYDGQRHPYWNLYRVLASGDERIHYEVTAVNLSPAQYVKFETYQVGPGNDYWQGTYDDVVIGIYQEYSATPGYRYMISGEETSCSTCAMGYVDLQNNTYNSGNFVYKSFCYTTSPNVLVKKGTYSPAPTQSGCLSGNRWNFNYR